MSRHDNSNKDGSTPITPESHNSSWGTQPSQLALEALDHLRTDPVPLTIDPADSRSFSHVHIGTDKAFVINENTDCALTTPETEIRSAVDGLRALGAEKSTDLLGLVAHFHFNDTEMLPHVAAALTAEVLGKDTSALFSAIAFENPEAPRERIIVGAEPDFKLHAVGDIFTATESIKLDTGYTRSVHCTASIKSSDCDRSNLHVLDLTLSTPGADPGIHSPEKIAAAVKSTVEPLLEGTPIQHDDHAVIMRIDATRCPYQWAALSAAVAELTTSEHNFSAIAVKVHPEDNPSHRYNDEARATGYFVVSSSGSIPDIGDRLDLD